jgi:chaperonin GroES
MTQQTEKKVSILPLGSRVVARRLEEEAPLKGGIILPDSAKKKQETVEIIAVGQGERNKDGSLIPMPVAVGDKVLMDKYSAQDVTIDGEEYVIIKADDIIAIVN